MAFQVITCPQSGQPETIEFELTPFGMVISSCTKLVHDDKLVCPRSCAKQRRCEPRALPYLIEIRSLMPRS